MPEIFIDIMRFTIALAILLLLCNPSSALKLEANPASCTYLVDCKFDIKVSDCDEAENIVYIGAFDGNPFDIITQKECDQGQIRLTFDSSDWDGTGIDFGDYEVEVRAESDGEVLDKVKFDVDVSPPAVTAEVGDNLMIDESFQVDLDFSQVYTDVGFEVYIDSEKILSGSCGDETGCESRYRIFDVYPERVGDGLDLGFHKITVKTIFEDEEVSEKVRKFNLVDKVQYKDLSVDLPETLDIDSAFTSIITLEDISHDKKDAEVEVVVEAGSELLGWETVHEKEYTVDLEVGEDEVFEISSGDFRYNGVDEFSKFYGVCDGLRLKYKVSGDVEVDSVIRELDFEGNRLGVRLDPYPPIYDGSQRVYAFDLKSEDTIGYVTFDFYLDDEKLKSIIANGEGYSIFNPKTVSGLASDGKIIAYKDGYCNGEIDFDLDNSLRVNVSPENPAAGDDFSVLVTQSNGLPIAGLKVRIDPLGLVEVTDAQGIAVFDIDEPGGYVVTAGIGSSYLADERSFNIIGSKPVTCYSNRDCRDETKTLPFCKDNNIVREVSWGVCERAGTSDSKCSLRSEQDYMASCGSNRCVDGECVSPDGEVYVVQTEAPSSGSPSNPDERTPETYKLVTKEYAKTPSNTDRESLVFTKGVKASDVAYFLVVVAAIAVILTLFALIIAYLFYRNNPAFREEVDEFLHDVRTWARNLKEGLAEDVELIRAQLGKREARKRTLGAMGGHKGLASAPKEDESAEITFSPGQEPLDFDTAVKKSGSTGLSDIDDEKPDAYKPTVGVSDVDQTGLTSLNPKEEEYKGYGSKYKPTVGVSDVDQTGLTSLNPKEEEYKGYGSKYLDIDDDEDDNLVMDYKKKEPVDDEEGDGLGKYRKKSALDPDDDDDDGVDGIF